jgi:hypothetical protein
MQSNVLRLDLIATGFSQTKTNRFIDLISGNPKLGEEPKKVPPDALHRDQLPSPYPHSMGL